MSHPSVLDGAGVLAEHAGHANGWALTVTVKTTTWLMWALVLLLAAPLLPWLVARASSSEITVGLLLLAVGALLWWRAPEGPVPPSLPTVAAVVGGFAAVLLVAGVAVDVRLLQAGACSILVWALLALTHPSRALTSLPALGLVLAGWPLSGDVDVIGFPLRVWSAQAAAMVLPVLGVPVMATETVLFTEGALADVEAPCAGLSTLRLVVAAVLVLGFRLSASTRSILVAVVVAVAVAVVGNATRVTVLSALVLGAHRPDLAALVHVPLGIVAFLAAAAAALPLLSPRTRSTGFRGSTGSTGLAGAGGRVVIAALIGLALCTTALRWWRHAPVVDDDPGTVDIDDSDPDALPLSAAEVGLWSRHALGASKRRIEGGEAIFVVARSLRAIHSPERCLQSNGHRVDVVAVIDAVIDGDAGGRIPHKRLTLNGGRQLGVSMLVSLTGTVASLSDRLLLALQGDDQRWVFVSAVVDAPADPVAEARLVADLHRRALSLLTGGSLSPADRSSESSPSAHHRSAAP
jgi:exosortase O